jgi:5'-nucleotidase (lipoprotein e(P4) family)
MIVLRIPLLALFLALCACAAAPDARVAAPVPADDNLNGVLWIQHSQEYAMTARTVYRAAHRLLDEALADPDWDAIAPAERSHPVRGLPPAIIVDIDETVLDNSAFQARLVRDGREFDYETWADWVDEARAIAVPGAVEFLDAAARRGVTVFYVTNREHAQREPTLVNLRQSGFPVATEVPGYLGLGMEVPGCVEEGQNKVCRRLWVAQRYRVLMQFGDQLSDFAGIGGNSDATRQQAMDEHLEWIGERWFMLPNPTYGYWESALFDNDWSLPREERRRIKREALRVH